MKKTKIHDESVSTVLSSHQAIILAKYKLPEDARGAISPGEYEEQFRAEVTGKVTVGEDFDTTSQIPWKEVALTLMAEMPAKRAGALVAEVIRAGKQEDNPLEVKLRAMLVSVLPKIPVRGRVIGTTVVRLLL